MALSGVRELSDKRKNMEERREKEYKRSGIIIPLVQRMWC